jgi:hypothetical protein
MLNLLNSKTWEDMVGVTKDLTEDIRIFVLQQLATFASQCESPKELWPYTITQNKPEETGNQISGNRKNRKKPVTKEVLTFCTMAKNRAGSDIWMFPSKLRNIVAQLVMPVGETLKPNGGFRVSPTGITN